MAIAKVKAAAAHRRRNTKYPMNISGGPLIAAERPSSSAPTKSRPRVNSRQPATISAAMMMSTC